MADDLGERSEAPTQKKLSDAREKGQIAKSEDLAGVITLAGSVVILIIFGGAIGAALLGLLRSMLTPDSAGTTITEATMTESARQAFGQAGLMMLPILAVAAGFGFLSKFVQVGWQPSAEPIRPKLDPLNPLKGFTRIFGKRGLAKSLMNTLKLFFVIGVATLVTSAHADTISALPALTAIGALAVGARLLMILILVLLAILFVIGMADYLYQRWQHTQDLKMTKQQVKDERRSMDGDPLIKSKRMQMAREIAMQRLGAAVPEADVIITNPTHFSVAIKYDTATMRAPRVTAKGADEIALRIRQLAKHHDVPVVQRPPLARAIYWGVEIGQEISTEHYEAVAEILAYVYRLEDRAPDRPRTPTKPARTTTRDPSLV